MPKQTIKPSSTGRSIVQNIGLALNLVKKATKYDRVLSGGIRSK